MQVLRGGLGGRQGVYHFVEVMCVKNVSGVYVYIYK